MPQLAEKYSITKLGPLGLLETTENGHRTILYRGPYAQAQAYLKELQDGDIPPEHVLKDKPKIG